MALRAEGAAALDCFEVTLKCEEGEDDEEAVVVAVIPRPEPMLRGKGAGGGGNLTSAWRPGARTPVPGPRSPGAVQGQRCSPGGPFPVGSAASARLRSSPTRVWNPRPPGAPSLPRPPLPLQGLETSILTERALRVFRFPGPPRAQRKG